MARPRTEADAMLHSMLHAMPAAFTRRQARASGMSAALLHRLASEGSLHCVGHGMFLNLQDGLVDLDLVEARLRSPLAMVCLTSALARHGHVDEVPARRDLAVPRGSHSPALRAPVT